MKKTAYLIGATVGMTKLNIEAFEAVQRFLEKADYDVTKPHDLFDDWDSNILSQREHIERRQKAIDEAGMVVLIPGFALCSFARADHNHAERMLKEVKPYMGMLQSKETAPGLERMAAMFDLRGHRREKAD